MMGKRGERERERERERDERSFSRFTGSGKKLGRKEERTRAGKDEGVEKEHADYSVGRTGTEWIRPLNIESPSIRSQYPDRPLHAGGWDEVRGRGRCVRGRKKIHFEKRLPSTPPLTAKSSLTGFFPTPPFFPFFSSLPLFSPLLPSIAKCFDARQSEINVQAPGTFYWNDRSSHIEERLVPLFFSQPTMTRGGDIFLDTFAAAPFTFRREQTALAEYCRPATLVFKYN